MRGRFNTAGKAKAQLKRLALRSPGYIPRPSALTFQLKPIAAKPRQTEDAKDKE